MATSSDAQKLLTQQQVYTLFCNTYLNVPITYDIQVFKYLKSLKKTGDDIFNTIIEIVDESEKNYVYSNTINNITDPVIKSIIKAVFTNNLVEDPINNYVLNNAAYSNSEAYDYLCLNILYYIYTQKYNDERIDSIIKFITNAPDDNAVQSIINALQKIIPSKLVTDILVYIVNKYGSINIVANAENKPIKASMNNDKGDIDTYINTFIHHQILEKTVSTKDIVIECDKNFMNMITNINATESGSGFVYGLMKNLISYNIEDTCMFVYTFINRFNKIMQARMYDVNSNILKLFTKIDSLTCVNFVKFIKCINGVYKVFYNTKLFPDSKLPGNYNDRDIVVSALNSVKKYSDILDINIKDKLDKYNKTIFNGTVNNFDYTKFFDILRDRVYDIVDNSNPNMMYNLYLNVVNKIPADISNFNEYLYDLSIHHRVIASITDTNYSVIKTFADHINHGSEVYVNDKLNFTCDSASSNNTYMSIILSNYCSKDNKGRTLDSTIFYGIDKHDLFPNTNIDYSAALSIDISTNGATVNLFGKDVYNINYESKYAISLNSTQQLNAFKLFTINGTDNDYTFDDLLVDILYIIFVDYPYNHGNKFCYEYAKLDIPLNISLANYINTFDDKYHQSLDTLKLLMKGIEYAYYQSLGQMNWLQTLPQKQQDEYKRGYNYLKNIYKVNAPEQNNFWTSINMKFNPTKYLNDHIKDCVESQLKLVDCDELIIADINKYTALLNSGTIIDLNIDEAYMSLDATGNITGKPVMNGKYTVNYISLLTYLKNMVNSVIHSDSIVPIPIVDAANNTEKIIYAKMSNVINAFDKITELPNKLIDVTKINYMSVYDNYVKSVNEYSLLTNIFAITYALFKLGIDIDCTIDFDVYCKILNYGVENINEPYYLHHIYANSIKPYIINNLSEIYDLCCTIVLKLIKIPDLDESNIIMLNANSDDKLKDYFEWFNKNVRMSIADLSKISGIDGMKYYTYDDTSKPIGNTINANSSFSKKLDTSLMYRKDSETSFYTLTLGLKTYVFVNDSHLVAQYNEVQKYHKLDKLFGKIESSDTNDIGALLMALKLIACCILGDPNNITYQYLVSNIDRLHKIYNKMYIDSVYNNRNYGTNTSVTNDEYAFKTNLMEFVNIYALVCDKLYVKSSKLSTDPSLTVSNTFYLPLKPDSKSQELVDSFNKMFIKLFFIYNSNFTTNNDTNQVIQFNKRTKYEYISLPLFNTDSVNTSVITRKYNFVTICDESRKGDKKVEDDSLREVLIPKSVGYIYYKVFFYIHMILNIMDHNETYCNRYSLSLILHIIHMFFDEKWFKDYYNTIANKTKVNVKNDLLNLDECFKSMRLVAIKISNANMTTFTKTIDEIESFITNCVSMCTVQDILQSHTCNPGIQMLSVEALSETYVNDYEFLTMYQTKINEIDEASKDLINTIETALMSLNDSDKFKDINSALRYNRQFSDDLYKACHTPAAERNGKSIKELALDVINKYMLNIRNNIATNFTTMLNSIVRLQNSAIFKHCVLASTGIFKKEYVLDRNRYIDGSKIVSSIINNIKGITTRINYIISDIKSGNNIHTCKISDLTNIESGTAIDYNNLTCGDMNGLTLVPLPANILNGEVETTDVTNTRSYSAFNVLYNGVMTCGLYVNLLYNCVMVNDDPSFNFADLLTNIFTDVIDKPHIIKDLVYSFGVSSEKHPSANESSIELNRLNVQSNIPTRNGLMKVMTPWDIFVTNFIKNNLSKSDNIKKLNVSKFSPVFDSIKSGEDMAKYNVDEAINTFFAYLYNYIKTNLSAESSVSTNEQAAIKRFERITKLFDSGSIEYDSSLTVKLYEYIFLYDNNKEFNETCALLLKNTGGKFIVLKSIENTINKISEPIFDNLTARGEAEVCDTNLLILFKLCTISYILTHYV